MNMGIQYGPVRPLLERIMPASNAIAQPSTWILRWRKMSRESRAQKSPFVLFDE